MTVQTLRARHLQLLRQNRVADNLDQEVRQLDGTDRYYTWSQVAAEPVRARLDRLAAARLRPDAYSTPRLCGLQSVLDDQLPELFGYSDELGWAVTTPFVTGVFPTGTLHALSRPIPGSGVLVLVDSGMLDMVPDVLRIMSVARPMFGEPPLLDAQQTTSALAEVFNAYLFGNGAVVARPLPQLFGQRLELVEHMARRATQFVVAHEMGHVLAGHLVTSWRVTDPNTPVGALDMQAVGWQNEYEADLIAAKIMLVGLEGLNAWELGVFEPYLVGALLLVLSLHEVIDLLARAAGRVVPFAGSHPPPLQRIQTLVDNLSEDLRSPRVLDFAADLATWLEEQLNGVVEWFRAVDQVMGD
jgi:hypothetical protein